MSIFQAMSGFSIRFRIKRSTSTVVEFNIHCSLSTVVLNARNGNTNTLLASSGFHTFVKTWWTNTSLIPFFTSWNLTAIILCIVLTFFYVKDTWDLLCIFFSFVSFHDDSSPVLAVLSFPIGNHAWAYFNLVMSLILLTIWILFFHCRVTHGCSTEGVRFPCNI